MKFILCFTFLISSIHVWSQPLSDNITEPLTYIGSHKELGKIKVEIWIEEMNEAKGYIETSNFGVDSVDYGGEENTLGDDGLYHNENGHLIINLNSGRYFHLYKYREEKAKMEYYDFALIKNKPLKIKLEKDNK